MKYDVVATTGTYEKDGEKKYLTKNVGTVMDTKNGPKLVLDASFNPAGCPRGEDGKVWLSLFEPRAKDEKPAAKPASANAPFNDEIPF